MKPSSAPIDAPARAPADERVAAAWRALCAVEDPEIPALGIVDLGIVRCVEIGADDVLRVGLSPTYSGCPATDVIRRAVEQALGDAGAGRFVVTTMLAPPWTSDWITPEGRDKLAAYGIVPPPNTVSAARQLLADDRPVACPRCQSADTECVSQFGSTPCKALHRCRACLEPFEAFKCI
ncbi:MAG TPA: 1,2-phenylacetyl-CoA epoxidase subunit PaaD [Steroidobacteraceae bacterium]|nr:1,2-phenylacetyl-CoA epoxidase subunit PaaD [Steroidobacteraceae bacterium]